MEVHQEASHILCIRVLALAEGSVDGVGDEVHVEVRRRELTEALARLFLVVDAKVLGHDGFPFISEFVHVKAPGAALGPRSGGRGCSAALPIGSIIFREALVAVVGGSCGRFVILTQETHKS